MKLKQRLSLETLKTLTLINKLMKESKTNSVKKPKILSLLNFSQLKLLEWKF